VELLTPEHPVCRVRRIDNSYRAGTHTECSTSTAVKPGTSARRTPSSCGPTAPSWVQSSIRLHKAPSLKEALAANKRLLRTCSTGGRPAGGVGRSEVRARSCWRTDRGAAPSERAALRCGNRRSSAAPALTDEVARKPVPHPRARDWDNRPGLRHPRKWTCLPDLAQPLGLIVNEFVTNSVKWSRPPRASFRPPLL
jgi:hypothetical protein